MWIREVISICLLASSATAFVAVSQCALRRNHGHHKPTTVAVAEGLTTSFSLFSSPVNGDNKSDGEDSFPVADEVVETKPAAPLEGQQQATVKREQSASPAATATEATDKTALQTIGATTGRGEFAAADQHVQAATAVRSLEALNPTAQPVTSPHMYGRWELIYCDTQLFRSSPFFMAGRAVCQDGPDADRYNFFCDMHRQALAMSTIRAVRQLVNASGRLVSEFEVSAGTVPFLNIYSGGYPLSIDGAIVSSADWIPTLDGTAWELYMDKVEIQGSNIPGLRQLLDQPFVQLESRQVSDALSSVVSQYSAPKPIFRTTYLDETFRISRDQDDNVFVYLKTDQDAKPTTYNNVPADLGIGKIWTALQQLN